MLRGLLRRLGCEAGELWRIGNLLRLARACGDVEVEKPREQSLLVPAKTLRRTLLLMTRTSSRLRTRQKCLLENRMRPPMHNGYVILLDYWLFQQEDTQQRRPEALWMSEVSPEASYLRECFLIFCNALGDALWFRSAGPRCYRCFLDLPTPSTSLPSAPAKCPLHFVRGIQHEPTHYSSSISRT